MHLRVLDWVNLDLKTVGKNLLMFCFDFLDPLGLKQLLDLHQINRFILEQPAVFLHGLWPKKALANFKICLSHILNSS